MHPRLAYLKTLLVPALTAALVVVVFQFGGPTQAQKPGPIITFADILADAPTEYASYQVKITYTGEQKKTIPTLLLRGPETSPEQTIADFTPFQSPGVPYGNDEHFFLTQSVSGDTIYRLIELGLGTRPALQVAAAEQLAAGLNPDDVVLSLMIERPEFDEGGALVEVVVFEHLGPEVDASQIYTVLLAAARGEPDETRELLARFRNFMVGP